ncbi:hypothetical protein ACFQZO_36755 [Bradyrhizobium sp. GCM10027634]|uniref:hypothetical protein n=1 Tax=unclassified Bradyrhizobium TaxID=2631580 RepID=UPI00263ABBAC|nr:hypothetical protein [Bradyrhizobium sp. WYCCWR 12677]MDN5006375.1 hypothetical protein [Bradyrhizobium sp. WYCCWR 12677]
MTLNLKDERRCTGPRWRAAKSIAAFDDSDAPAKSLSIPLLPIWTMHGKAVMHGAGDARRHQRKVLECMSSKFAGKVELSTGQSAWLLACAGPFIFLTALTLLALYGAPEHDDFCLAFQNVRDGFVQTVLQFYTGLSGRIVPLLIIQIPAAVAKAAGSSILPAYVATLIAFALLFVAGSAFAMVRMWPTVRGPALLALMLGFPAAIAGATPSAHDLLYWLPGLACYVPPGLVTILILGECVYAIDREREFSNKATAWAVVGAFLSATCNEFTAIWLVAILAASLLGRYAFSQKLQVGRHFMIAAAAVIGWLIVAAAPGNGQRMAAADGGWDLSFSIREGLRFALIGLRTLLLSPSLIGWLVLVVAISTATPAPEKQDGRREKWLAWGIVALCLGCCYFEYFLHQLVTGSHLVDRAQNQALILIVFGFTLCAALLARVYRRQLREKLAFGGAAISLDKPVWPLLLTAIIAISLYFSTTGSRLRRERATFGPFWQEAVARDRLLASRPDQVVDVPRHRWKPSTLISADINDNIGCVAMYYHNKELIPVDQQGGSSQ